jgi:hypothetical protein
LLSAGPFSCDFDAPFIKIRLYLAFERACFAGSPANRFRSLVALWETPSAATWSDACHDPCVTWTFCPPCLARVMGPAWPWEVKISNLKFEVQNLKSQVLMLCSLEKKSNFHFSKNVRPRENADIREVKHRKTRCY